ncbi:Inner membrane protein YohK [Sinobacterium norvegicum]|uniref:Inner membrane protein YohK n=1 Tax=Sinobacterium norvegicum TaxID=1641715 RepID=A0ABN8EHR7_9GAMM|nr:LrgB family protein [Sinobacterium norvegicum]CAH0991163.1 Inner membrane protein YohK [Sinobacterium norvegicum]
MTEFQDIWTYLSSEPLLWLTATLMAYVIGDVLFLASGKRPYVNPVLIAVALLAVALMATGTSYEAYFEGAKFVHFMLGPATVCLAVPLFLNIKVVGKSLLPMLVALVLGSLTAIVTALGTAYAFGIRGEVLLSLAPKSVTAPVAMGISESIGGSPTLTAVMVIITGITGAIICTPLLNALRIKDYRARGFAVGVSSHGIGTARAFQVSETAGVFSGIGMGANALATSILVPLVLLFS